MKRRPPRSWAEFRADRIRRVLILNATALGDWLFSLPAIRALGDSFPHWHLEALVHPRVQSLAACHPGLRRLWLYPGRGTRFLRLLRELSRQRFDVALILHGNDPEATLLAWATGAPFVVGSAKSPLSFAYSAALSPRDPLEHAVERRLAYARLLGAEIRKPVPELCLPAREREKAGELLRARFGKVPALLVALHPTGSAPYKWWPLEGYLEVGRYLQERHDAALLLISGAQDRQVAETLALRLPGPTLVTGGRYSLVTVAALLSHCRLMIGNDSGPLHLAMALKVPTLALLGPDHPARIGPYRAPWATYLYKKETVCPHPDCLTRRCPDNLCLQAIRPAEVLAALKEWWEPGPK